MKKNSAPSRVRAHVYVKLEPSAELKLCVQHIYLSEAPRLRDDVFSLVFEWFTMVGNSDAEARQNCIDSIAFYMRCRPDLRDAISKALDPSCQADVATALSRYDAIPGG